VTNAQLSRLFDFQRFAGNARLQKIIDDMMYTVIKGERRHVCCKCMGVR